MEKEEKKTERLCSEIQLFDLCSKDRCEKRNGRYCTEAGMLARFEAISEEEDQIYIADEIDDFEEADDLDYDEEIGMDGNEDDQPDESY